MGRDIQTEHIKSTCNQCSIGCGMEIVTRGGNVLRIVGDWDAEVNSGRLCKNGRFDPLYDERDRVTQPMIKSGGKLRPSNWDEALKTITEKLGGASAQEIGVLTSSNSTNEALYLLGQLFCKELKATIVGLLNSAALKLFDKPQGSLADIAKSDVILVAGVDTAKDHPVASFIINHAVDKGAKLLLVNGADHGLAPFATMVLADIGKAVEVAERAASPTVIYGAGIASKDADILKKLQGKASFIAIEPGINTRAAVAFGLSNGFKASAAKVLYTVLGEQGLSSEDVLKDIDKQAFVVVQASYVSPLTEKADVLLPMAIWSERAGSLTNTEGRVQKVSKAVEPAGEAKPDWEIISLLASKLGKKLGTSLDEISARATQELK